MDLYFEITFAHSTDQQLAYSVWAQRHIHMYIWERIWEKGPIGNFFTNSIPEKLPF